MAITLDDIYTAVAEDRIVEFLYDGKQFLIQSENNKGWDYISIWQIDDPPVCLGRALFDIFDGIGRDTVEALLSQSCINGHCFEELFPVLSSITIH